MRGGDREAGRRAQRPGPAGADGVPVPRQCRVYPWQPEELADDAELERGDRRGDHHGDITHGSRLAETAGSMADLPAVIGQGIEGATDFRAADRVPGLGF